MTKPHCLAVSSTLQGKLCLMALEVTKTVSKDASVYIRWGCGSMSWVRKFLSVWWSSRWKCEYKMKRNRKRNSVAPLSLGERWKDYSWSRVGRKRVRSKVGLAHLRNFSEHSQDTVRTRSFAKFSDSCFLFKTHSNEKSLLLDQLWTRAVLQAPVLALLLLHGLKTHTTHSRRAVNSQGGKCCVFFPLNRCLSGGVCTVLSSQCTVDSVL